jgi:hypothetical protein
MKKLISIFAICLLPFAFGAHANIGSAGAMDNNQWNQLMNPRSATPGVGAVADFGNCDALIQRCAAPRCAGGRCTDMQVAIGIVNGCVQASEQCRGHGDALVQSIAAQMVANSTVAARANEASAAANAGTALQIEQMRQEMLRSQQESDRRMEQALAAQEQASLRMEQALTAQQQAPAAADSIATAAAAHGVHIDVLVRQQHMGQIESQLDNVKVGLSRANAVMQDVFNYARCDQRGDGCEGPRRVARFKELANLFFDPYETTMDSIYDALVTAQMLGVDIMDIYHMLSGSCHSWGQFLCTPGQAIRYIAASTALEIGHCACDSNRTNCTDVFGNTCRIGAVVPPNAGGCQLLHVLANNADVQQNWIYPEQAGNRVLCNDGELGCVCETTRDGHRINCHRIIHREDISRIEVACASDALENSPLFAHRRRQSNIDARVLQMMITQDASSSRPTSAPEERDIRTLRCSPGGSDGVTNMIERLERSTHNRLVPANMCIGSQNPQATRTVEQMIRDATNDSTGAVCNTTSLEGESQIIHPVYALCTVHAYNIGLASNPTADDREKREQMNRVIQLKSTVITQQMKRQYDFLEATVRRLETQLRRAAITTSLEAAGANTGRSTGTTATPGGGIAGMRECNSAGGTIDVMRCLNENIGRIPSEQNIGNRHRQLVREYGVFLAWARGDANNPREIPECENLQPDRASIDACINRLRPAIQRQIEDRERENRQPQGR